MAAAKKAPPVRSTYFFGKKTIKAGAKKGGVKPGFISIPNVMASALGIKFQLPSGIPETTYTIKNGIIFDTHPVKGGRTATTPVRGVIGRKKVSLVVKTIDAKKTQAGKATRAGDGAGKVKGSKTVYRSSVTNTLTLGIPAWGSIEDMQTFLKGSKVLSFAFDGEQYPVAGSK